MAKSSLIQALRGSSLAAKNELLKLARPAIYAQSIGQRGGSIAVGVSRLGGLPDLPPTLTWPSCQGSPLWFIAQINFDELPNVAERTLLPATGRLYFFYYEKELPGGYSFFDGGGTLPDRRDLTTENRVSIAVLYSDAPRRQLKRAVRPSGLKGTYKSVRLKFSTRRTLPNTWYRAPEGDTAFVGPFATNDLGVECLAMPRTECKELFDTVIPKTCQGHQLFGYPYCIGSPMELECEMIRRGLSTAWTLEHYRLPKRTVADVKAESKNWLVLLQVDSDKKAGMMRGTLGCFTSGFGRTI